MTDVDLLPPYDRPEPVHGLSIDHDLHAEQYSRVTPPGGRRWRQLAALDERVDGLDRRATALADEYAGLLERHAAALVTDKTTLAAWIADERGKRPAPAAPLLERRLEEVREEQEALEIAVRAVLKEKAQFVDAHRSKLVKEARKEKAKAIAEIERRIGALEQARVEAVELLRLESWCKHFPGQEAGADPASGFARGGRVIASMPELNRSRLEVHKLYSALREDADWIAHAHDDVNDEPDPAKEAIWVQTPEGQRARAQEQQRADAANTPTDPHRAVWGKK